MVLGLQCHLLFAQKVEDYEKAYSKEYQSAIQFIKNNKTLFQTELSKNATDMKLIISAVFPEMVRFSEVSNLMETSSLELLYTRFGTSYADFSIGRFQMKPSFIEKLEKYIVDKNLKAHLYLTEYKTTDEKEKRAERMRRLKDLAWQLRYLNGFYALVENRFGNLWQSNEEKLRFLASAYNRGFEQSKEEIARWVNIKAFPYGKNYRGTQYAYTDIAVYFYKKDLKWIFP